MAVAEEKEQPEATEIDVVAEAEEALDVVTSSVNKSVSTCFRGYTDRGQKRERCRQRVSRTSEKVLRQPKIEVGFGGWAST